MAKYCCFEIVKISLRKKSLYYSLRTGQMIDHSSCTCLDCLIFTLKLLCVWALLCYWQRKRSFNVSAIGYCVVVQLCLALSLADIHVIKWQSPLKLVRTAWRTPYSYQPRVNGCKSASYTHYPIRTYEYENSQILIGRLNAMRRDFVMI